MSSNKHVVPANLATLTNKLSGALGCGFVALSVTLSAVVNAVDQSTDGTGERINWLIGAEQIIDQATPDDSGEAGDDIDLRLTLPATYTVGVGVDADPYTVFFTSNGGAANPWASGLLAASFGADGSNLEGIRHPSLNPGGNGGSVTLDTTGIGDPANLNIVLNTDTLPSLVGRLTLSGVYALSQGGKNSRARDTSAGDYGDVYSDSGNAGNVTVDFQGLISDTGSFHSNAGPLISNVVGITAISRGGVFSCAPWWCAGEHYTKDNDQTPGNGGDVTVTLHSGSAITLDGGSATGIYAASMNGAILGREWWGTNYAINPGDQSAGDVFVALESNTNIAVGGGTAAEAYGVLALSAGSELGVPLQYQSKIPDLGSINIGTAATGGDVTVVSAGDISATGLLAMGITALNLGGEAAVGLLGSDQAGVYEPVNGKEVNKLSPRVLGDISVNNAGNITVNGETGFGILAASFGRGFVFHSPTDLFVTDLLPPQEDFDDDGIINALDEDDDNDELADWEDPDDNNNGIPDYPCVANDKPGEFPICDGTETGLVMGEANSDASTSGGNITVENSGIISIGQEMADNAFSIGVAALSVGGGGAAGSGGLGILAGDNGGAGGHGGSVTVVNSGDITTYGNHSPALLASSIGGGGGVGGSNTMPFVAVGGDAGDGGHGGGVDITLDGNGALYTHGDLSDAVLAQSVGGGGGVGGSGTAWGLEGAIAIGGKGGEGGDGANVSISANHNDDPMTGPIQGSIDQSDSAQVGFDIVTLGSHSSGLMAQSIGGGGGTAGSATSKSMNFYTGLTLSIGRNGPGGGHGGDVDIHSNLDIYVEGESARGISAQSIGGGGGKGGDATAQQLNVEKPTTLYPNIFADVALGGAGGDGGNSGSVEVANGGVVQTVSADAIGILAQSIAGGGGDAGAAKSWSQFLDYTKEQPAQEPTTGKAGSIEPTTALTLTTSIGRSGGDGGDAGSVQIFNGFQANNTDSSEESLGGFVQTDGNDSAGLVAQSIGGGGGIGGTGHVKSGKFFWFQVAQALASLEPKEKPDPSNPEKKPPQIQTVANLKLTASIGGDGGAAGNGGEVHIVNGIQDSLTGRYQPGTVITTGGNAYGALAQSIGGGGGLAGGGAGANTGGLATFGLAIGGQGGAGGDGGGVSVINPTGGVIRTGEVIIEASTAEEIEAGFSDYTILTRGGGAVGILAQSVGGGGGAGGSASSASTLPDKLKGDAKVAMAWLKVGQAVTAKVAKPGEKEPTAVEKWWANVKKGFSLTLNLAIAGPGGDAGSGGKVDVINDGFIETMGELAHGIHAQSIGGGGGTGGSVAADPVNWQTLAAAPAEFSKINVGANIGSPGGEGNHGGDVNVTHGANGTILTSGYGAHGIFAQSIGGSGGYGGVAAANSEGFLYLGYTKEGDGGAGGAGGAVSVASAGVIETVADDANGILAQSIGGGGGSVAVGCTNSDVNGLNFHVVNKGQSPCWGNFDSDDGLTGNQTTRSEESDAPESNLGAFVSVGITTGAQVGTSDHGMDGGTVDIEVSNLIATHGFRSMGVVAQSIGGGGSYVSQDATAFAETMVGFGAGVNHSHGGAVSVSLSGQGGIETYGPGAWGILAQSIGGSGGFTGDPSLNLGLLASNTVDNVCCGDFSNGSDGGTIDITLAQGTEITTHGTNAHGIVAQSIGGGGGIAAGGKNDPNALVYMGNPRSQEWDTQGLPDITMTGQGGAINIDIAQDAAVGVYGNGSVGILAQSSGNSGYQSPITINVDGSVFSTSRTTNDAGNVNAVNLAIAAGSTGFTCGGCLNGSAIMISGGTSGLEGGNRHGNDPNLITVGSTGHVSVADLDFAAIYSTYGYTNVKIYGEVIGGIVLGDSISDPTLAGNLGAVIIDGGHWTPGTWNVVDDEHSIYGTGVYNAGVMTVSRAPTLIMGSLKQSEVGEMRFNLDPVIHSAEYALTISGLAQIDGTITPVVQTLLPGDLRVLTAGKLEGSPNIVDPLLFDWHLDMANGRELSLSATADFQPAGIDLTHNAGATAQYLTRIWESGDATLGSHFAYMLALETEYQYSSMLTALSEPEVLQHDVAALRAMPAFMGDVIDCADASGAQVQGDKANCIWLQAGMSSGRYDGSDTQRTDIDSTLFAIGMQREIQPGWYLGGAFGRNRSDIKANAFRGDGHTDMFALGLRHEAGDWSMGASLAYGNGSFDSMRNFALPGIVGARSASNATMSSASGLDVIALQAQASYRFEWDNVYLRPELSLAVSNVERDAFEEESMVDGHTFLLQAASDSSTLYWVTPHVELGGQWQVGEGTQLKAYVDAGVRVAPWDSEIDLRFAGVSEGTGWFRNSIDEPLSAAMLKAGVELFSDESLALKLEYGLEDNGDYQIQTGSARVDWKF